MRKHEHESIKHIMLYYMCHKLNIPPCQLPYVHLSDYQIRIISAPDSRNLYLWVLSLGSSQSHHVKYEDAFKQLNYFCAPAQLICIEYDKKKCHIILLNTQCLYLVF